jgi:hypothetical protein
MGPIGVYLMLSCPSMNIDDRVPVRNAIIDLQWWLHDVTKRRLRAADLDGLEARGHEVLTRLELVWPFRSNTMAKHYLHHLVASIRLCGPVHAFWMYAIERLNGQLKRSLHAHKWPEMEIARAWCVREMLGLQHLMAPERMPLAKSPFEQPAYLADVLTVSASVVGRSSLCELLSVLDLEGLATYFHKTYPPLRRPWSAHHGLWMASRPIAAAGWWSIMNSGILPPPPLPWGIWEPAPGRFATSLTAEEEATLEPFMRPSLKHPIEQWMSMTVNGTKTAASPRSTAGRIDIWPGGRAQVCSFTQCPMTLRSKPAGNTMVCKSTMESIIRPSLVDCSALCDIDLGRPPVRMQCCSRQ